MKHVLILFLIFAFAHDLKAQERNWPPVINGIDMALLEESLKSDGVEGWIHAATPRHQVFVFTYRDPENFFKYVNFSLIPTTPSSAELLATLARHDKVKIKGQYSTNGAPFPHIWMNDIELIKKYESNPPLPPYQHETKLPGDLKDQGKLRGKVHAVFNKGKVLVIEYKDVVIPVFIQDELTVFTEGLYRNDLIEMSYLLRSTPRRPIHLELDPRPAIPIFITDSVLEGHGEQVTLKGTLAMFTKSPQILFNIFALKVKYPENNVDRNFTIVNFSDFDFFMKVLSHLQTIWDNNQETMIPMRNHFSNPQIKLKVSGIKNVVSPGQANAQIIIQSLDDIHLLE